MLSSGDAVLVGVSGGPDSVVLLFLLVSLKKEFNLKITVAHLDHKLRPNSYKDLKFVENLARKLNLPFVSKCINISKLEKRGSLEEIARHIRFNFFFETAKKLGIKKIALGHNLDDQAETVLMRLIRGSGLSGLSAIKPVKKIDRFIIIRPLIEIKRVQIEKFLKRKKIKTRTDYTNKDTMFFRNKIRHELLPFLEKKYNKNIKEILANTRDNIASDYEYLWQISDKAFKDCARYIKKSQIKIDLAKFSKFHQSIQRMILRRVIEELKGNTRRITFQHIKELESLIYQRPYNSIVNLPQGISVIKKTH